MKYYLIIINIITFILYFVDKRKAINKKERISEYNLLLFSVFGGSFLGILSMYLFKHKTKKKKFIIINILSIIMWIILLGGYNGK